jgi:uncharacterized membrane protein YcaP (DUF421 family)
MDIDWHTLWVPSGSLLELVLRGTIMFFGILAAMRVFRREAGALSTADLLVVILVADAAQNGMSNDYKSIPEGIVLVATIVGWSYVLDWLAFRYEWVQRLLQAPPLLLVSNGRINHRHLRAEMMTVADLESRLREQGVEAVSEVRRCYMESDGQISILRREPDRRPRRSARKVESRGH